MKYDDVRRYAELMKEFGLTSLEISDEGFSLKIEMGGTQAINQESASAKTTSESSSSAPSVQTTDDDYISIKSPMVGVFYRAPAENAPPYVKVGDTVKKGTVVGLIEAMKLMNEIVSDSEGIVESIPAVNGQTVDYGFELIRLKKQ